MLDTDWDTILESEVNPISFSQNFLWDDVCPYIL